MPGVGGTDAAGSREGRAVPIYVCHAVKCGGGIAAGHAFCGWHWSRLPPYLREIVSISVCPGGRLSAYTPAEAVEIATIHLAVRDGYMRCADARRRLEAMAAGFQLRGGELWPVT